jgi:hypothetical protein
LTDSIIEIDFLDRHLGLMSSPNVTMLDIGAGYGRLAHRVSATVPGLRRYICSDAIAYSTFVNEYYVGYRGVAEKTREIPLDEIERCLAKESVDIAVNICSFPECRLDVIEWWISLTARRGIRHFLVNCGSEQLQTNDGRSFSRLFEKQGYRLLTREPKYRDALVQQYAIAPSYYFLFELR